MHKIHSGAGGTLTLAQGAKHHRANAAGGSRTITLAQGARHHGANAAGGSRTVTLAQGTRHHRANAAGGSRTVILVQGTRHPRAIHGQDGVARHNSQQFRALLVRGGRRTSLIRVPVCHRRFGGRQRLERGNVCSGLLACHVLRSQGIHSAQPVPNQCPTQCPTQCPIHFHDRIAHRATHNKWHACSYVLLRGARYGFSSHI